MPIRALFKGPRSLLTIGWIIFATLTGYGQSNATLPEFEVASVKPANPNSNLGIGLFTYPGGRIVASQCTLRILIMAAFHIQDFQISGGPHWIRSQQYDIEAKPPSSSESSRSNPVSFKSPPTDEQRLMLQALLRDRFQLHVHRATKEGLVYLLEQTGKPLKLQSPHDRDAYPWAGSPEGGAVARNTGLAGKNISMLQLAARLSGFVGRPVIDETGLKGSFDFEYRTGEEDQDADATVTIVSSLKELGLRLKPSHGAVPIIVIDHVAEPSKN